MPARPAAVVRALLAVGLLAASAAPAAAATPGATQVYQLDGTGFGHGVGMAQVSAQAMALAGQDHEQILQYFYPGTGRDRRSATLAVAVWEADAPTGSVTVALPSGGSVSDGSRSAAIRPGAVLGVSVDADGYHVREQNAASAQPANRRTAPVPTAAPAVAEESGSPSPSPSSGPIPSGLPTGSPSPSVAPPSGSPTPTASPGPSRSPRPTASPSPSARPGLSFDSSRPLTLTPSSGVTEVRTTGRSYRGQLRALAREGFRLVNDVDLEVYLRGLGEVPKSWRPAALRTQAVAARTYALRSTGRGRPLGFDICDDTRCQVYLGAGAEGASTTAAAEATRGEVVTFGGGLADTFYSANAGGRTASPGEGFGGSQTSPYLPSNKPTAGDTDPWQVRPTPAAVAARLGYPGRLTAMTVTARGPSGRVQRVRLDGSTGAVEVTGVAVQRALSLRSNLFTVRLTTGVADVLAPPGTAPGQLPPGEVATGSAPPPLLVPPPAAATPTALIQPRTSQGLPVLPVALTAGLLALTAVGVLVAGTRAGWPLPRRTSRTSVVEPSH